MIRTDLARDPAVPRQRNKLDSLAPKCLDIQVLPGWTRWHDEGSVNGSEAAFAAGAALLALDRIVRADPPWLGALRMRQALASATASARLLRLREDEGALRDAHHLTRPGDNPGPAGRLHRTWRDLARWPARLDAHLLHRLGRELDLKPSPALLDRLAAGQGRGNPVAVAAEVAATVAAFSPAQPTNAEVFGFMLADVALAARLGWSTPLPLLATAALHPALKRATGRRPRPGDADWSAICLTAYARAAADAHARALALAERAKRLLTIARQVRTRGGSKGISALMADDAVAPAALTGLGSDRAARRFLERLAALGALRELTGRPSFRLYGL